MTVYTGRYFLFDADLTHALGGRRTTLAAGVPHSVTQVLHIDPEVSESLHSLLHLTNLRSSLSSLQDWRSKVAATLESQTRKVDEAGDSLSHPSLYIGNTKIIQRAFGSERPNDKGLVQTAEETAYERHLPQPIIDLDNVTGMDEVQCLLNASNHEESGSISVDVKIGARVGFRSGCLNGSPGRSLRRTAMDA
ncbi:hypothetical protein BV22DRAFT_1034184 [Leucogyrophana mollusca]|uniref:Uncharacterized protein n=1 Tax=Leucogyrophana mollusca TaxID=85980 RepID=A0ACB8BJ42_9AGAM|nr:hypothetical protein BV22DRAFT_1034184 [Leucogyrophana mollusca]